MQSMKRALLHAVVQEKKTFSNVFLLDSTE